ncbi:MAG: hypothetical protein AAFV95_19530 [Bacteroidota bacterium]
MENSRIQAISSFESSYELYTDSYNKLISCSWEEKNYWHEQFERNTNLSIKNYLYLIQELNLDYTSAIKMEIDTLINGDSIPEIEFDEKFKYIYKNDTPKYFFLMFLILKKNPEIDISYELLGLSEYIFKRDDWQSKIKYIIESLGIYGNPDGLFVVEKLLQRLKEEKEVYDEEIGNHLLVYLLELPSSISKQFLEKYEDYPIKAISKHFRFLKDKID